MSYEENSFAQLIGDWHARARPLILADEVRTDETEHKEIVSFIFVWTDTRTATRFADEAMAIRNHMPAPESEWVIKGSDLFGRSPRPTLNEFRGYVEMAVLRCPIVVRITTTSPTLTRYKTIAPGGIRRESNGGSDSPIKGRELVPFMNMLKVVATGMNAGDVQVDVLMDRSFNLGLDPRQLGIEEDEIAIIGPGRFNERKDGSAASLECPSSFQLVCPPKASAFRDLLLIPDAIAYRMRPILPTLDEELRRVDFRVDVFPLEREAAFLANVRASIERS